MKHNFAIGVLGGLVGSGMLFILLIAAGIVGARSADVTRSDVSRANEVSAATPLTSTFTYQGQLINSGTTVSGVCDFQFSLYDALSAGNQIGLTQTVSSVSVSRGLFTALLNTGNEFGDTAFNGDARWLSIAVRCPTGGAYTPLLPRQPLTSLPFALPGLRTFPNAYSPNIIGGYSGNTIAPGVAGATIAGGGTSGNVNSVNASYATVGGGMGNGIPITGQYAFIGGGNVNTASGWGATVSGGGGNTASGIDATVGGGEGNTASSDDAAVGGGYHNTASGIDATVGGGASNTVSNTFATVGGGYGNTASGSSATVPGGSSNTALGNYSFAAGRRAQANHIGAFVWADSANVEYASTMRDQFAIRATNGVSLSVNAGSSKAVSVGEHFRDNAIIAWAKVNAAGVVSTDFGVESLSHLGAGTYAITLTATTIEASNLIPIAIAEIDTPPVGAANVRIVSIDQIGASTFRVYINDGTFALVDNDFVFMVTGR